MSSASGTSTSPPRANRSGQYVKRSLGSCGPTISPGRTISVRSGPNAAIASRSHRYFSAPYVSRRHHVARRVRRQLERRRRLVDARAATRRTPRCWRRTRSGRRARAAPARSSRRRPGRSRRCRRPRPTTRPPAAGRDRSRGRRARARRRETARAPRLPRWNSVTSWPRASKRLDDVTAQKDRPAEHEDAHYIESGALTPHSASVVASTVFVAMHRPSRAVVVASSAVSTRQAS